MSTVDQTTESTAKTIEKTSTVDNLLSKINLNKPSDPITFKDAYKKESESGKFLFALNKLIEEIGATGEKVERLDKDVINLAISNIDKKISAQVRAIMHEPEFKTLEASWRGLYFAVNRTDFENNQVEILNCPKEKLMDDFEDINENIIESGLYKQIYDKAYNQPGAAPISYIVANYEIDKTTPDLRFINKISRVCAAAHCPLITSVGHSFFRLNSLEDLTHQSDIDALFSKTEYTKWNSFRKTEDAKYVGLTMNRFLLRLPYDPENEPVKTFDFEEFDPKKEIDSSHYLWGNPAFAFMANINRSFSKNGWSVNIRGEESGGKVEDLPVHEYQSAGSTQLRLPAEIRLAEDKEYKLSECGFIPLSPYENQDFAVFFGAHSAQFTGKNDADGKLAANLPYLFLVSRLSHYLKVIQRSKIGSTESKDDLQKRLVDWIGNLVTGSVSPDEKTKAKYPLQSASVVVEDNPDAPGYYQVTMKVKPHFQVEGVNIDLSLVSRMPT